MHFKQLTIPKTIFFIWLGNQIPKYVAISTKAFKEMNPDFEIVFIHRTMQQLKEIWESNIVYGYDIPLKRSLQRVINEEDEYIIWQKNFYGPTINFLQLLSDIARVEILNSHGGIYVDCDTFPICKFDDELLSKKFFRVRRRSNGRYVPDNFFLGKQLDENNIVDPYNVSGTSFIEYTLSSSELLSYWFYRKKFFNGTIKLGDGTGKEECYIDHYNKRSWNGTTNNYHKNWFDLIWKR